MLLPGISLCMIVKNSEHHMRRCLNSIKGGVDQLVIVDTGSTDRTKEIAAEFGAEIHDFVWVNDFSAARNYSLEFARHEWIMVLDSDHEAAFTVPQLRQAVATAEQQHAETIYLWIVDTDNQGKRYASYSQPQLWRNGRGVKYVNPIHEMATVSSHKIRTRLEILHYGYFGIADEELAKKRCRNLTMLGKEYDLNPDNTRTAWELAQEYCATGNFTTALPIIQHAIACWRQQRPNIPAEPLMLEIRIRCLIETQQHEAAFAAVAEAMRELPLFPIFPMLQQKLLVLNQRWQESLTAFEQYAQLTKRYQNGEILQDEPVVFGIADYPQVLKAAAQSAVIAQNYAVGQRYFMEYYQIDPAQAIDTLAQLAARMPGEELLTLLTALAKQQKTPQLKQLVMAVLVQIPRDGLPLAQPLIAELRIWPD